MEISNKYKAVFMNNYYDLPPDVEFWFLHNSPKSFMEIWEMLNLRIGNENPIGIQLWNAVAENCEIILYKKGEMYERIKVHCRKNQLGQSFIDMDDILKLYGIEYQPSLLHENDLELEPYVFFLENEGYGYVKFSDVSNGPCAFLLTICLAPGAKTIFKPGTDKITNKIWSTEDYSSDILSFMNWIFMKNSKNDAT